MIVKTTISPLWLAPDARFRAAKTRLAAILSSAPQGTEIFFRADDIGAPGDNCRKMMALFRKHRVPLHMAVTPAWLTESRWDILKGWGGNDGLFIWHQHGWRHVNHQRSGKKGEFGTDRSKDMKKADLAKGRAKLEAIMGNDFSPLFTPPWNRVDAETVESLVELEYAAISRSAGEQKKVPVPNTLPDIPVNVDLHTRSEADPESGLAALLDEFKEAVASGRVGVMLHHQRMNESSFRFLDDCLASASSASSLSFRHISQ